MIAKTTQDMVQGQMALPPLPFSVTDDIAQTAARMGVAEQLPHVIELSRDLFGSAIALGVIEDPELADWTHIAVYAKLMGTVDDAVARQENWCDLLRDRIGDAASFFTLLADFE